jgi:hypothetical protein
VGPPAGVVASFHLHRYPRRWAAAAMAGTLLDRPALARTPGLRFARGLGTGRGDAMGLGADLRRWATFAVWEGDDALGAFLDRSPLARRWRTRSEESYTLRMRPVAGHGAWGGRDPFGPGLPEGLPRGQGGDGPVAVLTRARIAVRHWPAFQRSVGPVEAQLRAQPGVVRAIGIGERPLGLQATFSLWASASAVEAFAYAGGPHAEVVRRTRDGGWFTEELFVRLAPYASEGTWDASDPLAGGNGS